MMSYWIRLINNLNWLQLFQKVSLFTQLINTSNNIIIKNGMKEIELSLITSIHHISHKIKQKMQMEEFGQPISLKLEWDQVVLTISITSQLDITTRLHLVLMFQRENISTHTLTTWLLVWLNNLTMVLLTSMMVLQLQPHKWHLMSPISSIICREELVTRDQIKWPECICLWPDLSYFIHSNISRPKHSIETYFQLDTKCTQLEMVSIINILRLDNKMDVPINSEDHSGLEKKN